MGLSFWKMGLSFWEMGLSFWKMGLSFWEVAKRIDFQPPLKAGFTCAVLHKKEDVLVL